MKNLKKFGVVVGFVGLVLTSQSFAQSKTAVVANEEVLTAAAFDDCLADTSLSPKALAKLMSLKNISGAFMDLCLKIATLKAEMGVDGAAESVTQIPKMVGMAAQGGSPVPTYTPANSVPTITSRTTPSPNLAPKSSPSPAPTAPTSPPPIESPNSGAGNGGGYL